MKFILVLLFWLAWPTAFFVWQWVRRDRQYSKWHWEGFRDHWRGCKNPNNGSVAYFLGQEDAKRTAFALKFLGVTFALLSLAIIVPITLFWSLQ